MKIILNRLKQSWTDILLYSIICWACVKNCVILCQKCVKSDERAQEVMIAEWNGLFGILSLVIRFRIICKALILASFKMNFYSFASMMSSILVLRHAKTVVQFTLDLSVLINDYRMTVGWNSLNFKLFMI